MPNKEERVCPCCGSKERKGMSGVNTFIPIQFSNAGGKAFIEIVVCAKCGCAYDSIIGGDKE